MRNRNLPTISILIPTLNAARFLKFCLGEIRKQDYPKEKIEVIIADGGSTDQTLMIAHQYKAKVYSNPLKTGEAGKAVALRHARGELIALIDSDNILPDKNWLRKMVEPFSDPEVIGSEPWEFTYRKKDGFIDRYCALMGMNDPLCYFLGNYDRLNVLSGSWTGLNIDQEDRGGWLKVILKHEVLPTIGANGTLIRREIFKKNELVKDYLVDIDILAKLTIKKPVAFAKVKIGIIHLYCGSDILKFIRKQKRRIKDYLYYQQKGVRHYPWQKHQRRGLVKFILSCFLIFPLIYQILKGYFKKPDSAWLFHFLACWLTFLIYTGGVIEGVFRRQEMSRQKWRQ